MYFNKKYKLAISVIRIISELFDFRKKYQFVNLSIVNSVLIVDFQQIGDIIVSTGFIRDLKREHRGLEISILGLSFLKDILEYDDNLKHIYTVKGGWKNRFKVAKELKSNFDLVICPRGDVRDILLGRIISKKHVLSFNFSGGDFLLDLVAPTGNMSHISHRQIQLGKFLKLYDENSRYSYSLEVKISPEKKGKDEVAVHIGSSRQLRQLPEVEIKEIVEYLLERGKSVTFFDAPGLEKGVSERLLRYFKEAKFRVWKGGLSDFIIELRKFPTLITTDSAQAHLAAGWGAKTVVIFGPSAAGFCRPLGMDVVEIAKANVDCSPCTQYKCTNRVHQFCYQGIHNLVVNELSNKL